MIKINQFKQGLLQAITLMTLSGCIYGAESLTINGANDAVTGTTFTISTTTEYPSITIEDGYTLQVASGTLTVNQDITGGGSIQIDYTDESQFGTLNVEGTVENTGGLECNGTANFANLDLSGVTDLTKYTTGGNGQLNITGTLTLPANANTPSDDYNFKVTLGEGANVLPKPTISTSENQITVSAYGKTTGITDDSGNQIEDKIAKVSLEDLAASGANSNENTLKVTEDLLNIFEPTITEDTSIDFNLDLSEVTDLSSFDTGDKTLTITGDLTLPESIDGEDKKASTFKVTLGEGAKVIAKPTISTSDNQITISQYNQTTGITDNLGNAIETKIAKATISDIINDTTVNTDTDNNNILDITQSYEAFDNIIDSDGTINFAILTNNETGVRIGKTVTELTVNNILLKDLTTPAGVDD